jgi:CheY-like chemotaxis protein
MDGLTATARIRANPRFAHLPVIALTAKAMAHDRERCLEAGADDYISKPIDVDKLISLCRVWLHQR